MSTPTVTLYGIPNCDTVKKSRAWLKEQGVECTFHDFKKQGIDAPLLARWIAQVGWSKLINRQGTTWRKLDAARQAAVADETSAIALMQEQTSIIKRPVVEWNSDGKITTTVGFDEVQWETLLTSARN